MAADGWHHIGRKWDALPSALRAGGGWASPDTFGEVARDPERLAGHQRMLGSYALHDYAPVPEALGLRGDEVVVDAGGGRGALATLLLRRFPDLRVTVLDRPEVVELVKPPADLAGRLTLRGGDLFQPWEVRAEAVVLARVLHDWEDLPARRILEHARAALPRGGRLHVVELVLPEGGAAGGLCDLHLLMATACSRRPGSACGRSCRSPRCPRFSWERRNDDGDHHRAAGSSRRAPDAEVADHPHPGDRPDGGGSVSGDTVMPPAPATIHNLEWVLWVDRLRIVAHWAAQRAPEGARARRLHQELLRQAEAADEAGRDWAMRPVAPPFGPSPP